LWYDSTDATVYIYYDGFWVDVTSGPDEVDLTDYATKQYVDDAVAEKDTLEELTDVDIDNPQNDDALIYDGENWKNQKITIDPTPQIFMLMGG
jgi:hypothetical protein